MSKKTIANELDEISCLLDQLSHRVERLANQIDPKLITPRGPKSSNWKLSVPSSIERKRNE